VVTGGGADFTFCGGPKGDAAGERTLWIGTTTMSELFETVSSGSEGERSEGDQRETTATQATGVVVDTSVSEWQRSLGAEAAAEAPAPLPDLSSSEDERSEGERSETTEATEDDAVGEATEDDAVGETTEGERSETTEATEATDDDGGAVVQQLFVGPSDSVPLLDVERLGLRHREVGCSATPTMGPAASGELTEGEMSDLESDAGDIDVGDVPNEAELVGLDLVFTDEAMAEMARRMPLWLRIVGVTVCLLYLGLFIRAIRGM
jgi:hypothetical protein